ncbi:uncharacterized protein LOC144096699 isoform X2 [Amblyomma americanum]
MLNLGYERKVIHGRRRLMRDDRGPPPVKRKRQESPSDESEASDAVQQTPPHNVVCIGHHSVSLPFSHGVISNVQDAFATSNKLDQVSLKTDAASSRLDASFEETTVSAHTKFTFPTKTTCIAFVFFFSCISPIDGR